MVIAIRAVSYYTREHIIAGRRHPLMVPIHVLAHLNSAPQDCQAAPTKLRIVLSACKGMIHSPSAGAAARAIFRRSNYLTQLPSPTSLRIAMRFARPRVLGDGKDLPGSTF